MLTGQDSRQWPPRPQSRQYGSFPDKVLASTTGLPLPLAGVAVAFVFGFGLGSNGVAFKDFDFPPSAGATVLVVAVDPASVEEEEQESEPESEPEQEPSGGKFPFTVIPPTEPEAVGKYSTTARRQSPLPAF